MKKTKREKGKRKDGWTPQINAVPSSRRRRRRKRKQMQHKYDIGSTKQKSN
jgi:hypothetical protein